jgi:hypothetical protein
VLFVQLPLHLAPLKARLEELAILHNRRLNGEAIEALQAYVRGHEATQAEEGGGK